MKSTPTHSIAVSANILNEKGETLLVKTHWRSDTWETPGGQVEIGEPLDEALCREVLEETGIIIAPIGITGIYYNATDALLSVVFKARFVSGDIRIQPEEIKEAAFVTLTNDTIHQFITRPHMRSRTIDSMNATKFVPYETWKVSPFELLSRLEN